MWRASCETCGWEQRADDYASAGEAARGHGDECAEASTLVEKRAHVVKTDIAWGGSGRDGDPWAMLSWDTERCECDQPWRHAWLA